MSFRTALAALAFAAAFASAHADSIALSGTSGNASSGYTYNYNYYQTNVSRNYEYFYPGETFTIAGLSGVTGASANILFTTSYTSTSASYTVVQAFGFYSETYQNEFGVTSSVSTVGTAQYSIPTTPMQTGS